MLLLNLLSLNCRLQGLTDDFHDEIKGFAMEDDVDERKETGFGTASSMERKHKKRKACI